MTTNPMETVKKLRDRVQKEAAELGLDVHAFSITPKTSDGTQPHDEATIVFIIGLDAIETDDETEKRQTDAAFEAIIGGQFDSATVDEDEAEAAERLRGQVSEAARETLEGWFNED